MMARVAGLPVGVTKKKDILLRLRQGRAAYLCKNRDKQQLEYLQNYTFYLLLEEVYDEISVSIQFVTLS